MTIPVPKVIPPLSVVQVLKVTVDQPAWTGYEGAFFASGTTAIKMVSIVSGLWMTKACMEKRSIKK
ncbi:MAG TPA: hypothetical protein VGG59_02830 [Acidobacteriaceae bacterium]